jgi:hypothetical protein
MKLFALAAAFALMAALPAGAAAQDPPKPKPEQKPEQKAQEAKPSYAGKWNMSVQTQNGPYPATVEIAFDEKEANKVKGTISSERGTSPIYGEIAEGTLWFAVSLDGTGELWFKANLQEDGSLAGALDMQGTQLPFTATRIKDK